MFKPVTQSLLFRNGFLAVTTMQPVRYLDWETKLRPIDPTEFLPKLKKSQLRIPVFQRRFELPRLERGKTITSENLNKYHWVYDRIIDKARPLQPFPEADIILTKNVTGVGKVGTKLRMSGQRAYNDFILLQRAVYASPANEERFKSVWEELRKTQYQYSSVTAEITEIKLKRMMLQLWMNMKSAWQVENWHIRVAFRRMGVIVPDECIELPQKLITGPDLSKEGKHFFVTVIINNKERVPIVCRLNHFTDDLEEALPSVPLWTKPFSPMFDEDSEKLLNLEPPVQFDKSNPYLDGFKPFTVLST